MSKRNHQSFYVCPRCNYKTFNRSDMKRHFERKRICADMNNMDLTPEIINRVLGHFVYHKPNEDTTTTKNINYNNYNMMLGILNSMESMDKVKLLTGYQKIMLLDFEDDLEKKYGFIVKRLETDAPTYGYLLTIDDLFNIVNTCTQRESDETERFNIFYDKAINRLKLYRTRSWESFLEDAGVKQLISLIKSYYLDTYEIYLIRNIHGTSGTRINRWQLKDHLTIYYQFLANFDLKPHILNLDDDEVMGHKIAADRQDFLRSTYYKLYNDEKKDQKESKTKEIKKKIVNIVKDNSVQNGKNLDKTLINLLKIDETFREELLKTRQLS